MPSQSCHFSVSLVLIFVVFCVPLAVSLSTSTKLNSVATTTTKGTTKTADTSTGASLTSSSTSNATTTTTAATTTTSAQSGTTEPPAYLDADCSARNSSWCDSSISGKAVCYGTCICDTNYVRMNNASCISITSLKPVNIRFTDISSTSMVVGWQMTASHSWKFNVTVTGNQSKGPPPLTGRSRMEANLTGLYSGDKYTITVTAYFTNDQNEVYYGMESANQAIDPATPGNVKQEEKYRAPNIILKWNRSAGIVEKYTVTFRGTNQNTSNDTPEIALTGLEAGKNYSVTITATSNERTSTEMNDQFTTVPEAPSPPENLAQNGTTNTSITLTWDPPEHPNGILEGYWVCYQGKVYVDLVYSTRNCKNAQNLTRFEVDSLTPGAFYDFKVYSFNTDFNSSNSANLSVRTLESVPGKVEGLAVEVSNNSFIVTWKRPSEPNGDIIMYKIDWHGDGLNCSDYLNTDRSNTPSEHENSVNCSSIGGETIEVNQKNISYTMTNLSPSTNYTVTVTPSTSEGPGASSITTGMTSVVPPGPVTNLITTVLNSTAVLVNWTIPETNPGHTNYNVLTYDVIQSKGPEHNPNCTVIGYYSTGCIVSGLEEYWVYQFVVESENSAGRNNSVRSKNTTTNEGEPGAVLNLSAKPFVQPCDATKINLSWEEPALENRNAKITAYIVTCQKHLFVGVNYKVDHPEPYRDPSKEFKGVLEGLLAETLYSCEMKAVTDTNKEGNPDGFNFTTGTCAPPAWPDGARIDETDKRTTTSFMVTLPKDFFTNSEQGEIKERGLIISKKGEGADLSAYKKTYWNYAKNYGFSVPYAVKIEITAISGAPNFEFPIGVNKSCPEESSITCNGELPPGEEFYVMAFACTSDSKCRLSPWYGGFRTAAKPVPPQEPNTGAVVAGVLVALGLVILIGAVFLLHRRGVINLTKFCPGGDEDPPPFDKVQPARPMPSEKGPVKFSDFDNYVQELHKDTNLLFSCQYEDIGKLSKVIYDRCSTYAANLEENKAKNRWVNILPFDHSRVKLQQLDDDDPTSDYINANFIPGFRHQRDYIATQGPLPGTIDDFWRMVWEHSVAVIVMLTQCKEGNRVKCEPYWPTEIHEPKQYGDVVVDPVSISTMNKYNITIFNVSVNDVKRMVYHFHYLEFPDMSANVEYDIFLEFLQAVRNHVPRDLDSPIVVHCSAGVGRTGTFIALDRLSQAINKSDFNWNDLVDIFDMVIGMRSNRTNMVQTESQYIMIHDCLCKMLEMKKRTEMSNSDENLYVNQAFDPQKKKGKNPDTDVLYENLKAKNEMKTDL